MSYTIALNSKNRANQTESPNNTIYNFDWSSLDEGEYKVSWFLTKKPYYSKYDIIDPYRLFLYYPFHFNQSNYATGKAITDATIQRTTTTISNNRLNITSPAGSYSGLQINRVIPFTETASIGFTYSCWFNTSSIPVGAYLFLLNIQDTLGYSGGRRFFITLNANRINVNSQYNTDIILLNTTYHLVVTIDRNNNAVIYLNNVANATLLTYPNWVNVAEKNYIGHHEGNTLIGWMQECRLYTRVITSTEVATLFNAGYNL